MSEMADLLRFRTHRGTGGRQSEAPDTGRAGSISLPPLAAIGLDASLACLLLLPHTALGLVLALGVGAYLVALLIVPTYNTFLMKGSQTLDWALLVYLCWRMTEGGGDRGERAAPSPDRLVPS